ncbi:sensor histidine kinase [Echinicola vietnamensis]|uniref:Putative regulator of cell autolysis n=1 Tax=Echinicola vietnamensis (strain DSM 17526 / LMG 23754 / KMM 6221) TaxID=926556 RepID=L0FXM5_ECHVK|nr:histidine kinase [Echinicola vietnamensis]AGA77410.1 putative regulator of cell autolysis [Echinicola vietnamensis DSM 17526]
MDRSRLYWIFQVFGWAAFAVINLFFVSLIRGITSVQVGAYLSLGAFYFVSTHYFRHLIKRQNWFNFNLSKLLIQAFCALLVLSFANVIATVLINWIFGILREQEDLKPIVLLVNMFISFLYYALWAMMYFLYHFLENYNTTLKYQAKINEVKLNQLRNQLNPHFIFNALNSVRALVDENPPKSKEAITQLSNILRYSLIMDKKRTIDFSDEIKIVRDYLDLESIRFEERLKVSYDIEKKAYQYKIPPMMLQTIVENAIKHGISNLMRGGLIHIKCSIGLSEDLYIVVKNSGQLTHNAQRKENDGSGHGISNTIQRLKLIYGSKAYFKMRNFDSEFVVTEIKIPKQNTKLD